MSYEVVSNIPLPSPRQKSGRYPFAQMKVGDSFLIPAGEGSAKNIGSAAYCWARVKRLDWKFTVRTTPEGLRCWRTA